MKFYACKFRSEDVRSYTYYYDGDEPLAIGDVVKVPDRSGDGWQRVTIASIGDEAPQFPTKPIIGKVEDEPEADTEPEAARASADEADDALLQSFLKDN